MAVARTILTLKILLRKTTLFKIFLRGFTKNVQEVLTGSHAVLQLTHFDAMPIAVTEALAVSRPVIVSDVGDMPLWIKDDLNGWVAPQATIGHIDLVLEKAWQNRSQLEEMGRGILQDL
jgi:glycosyltransferase involved in cell wall biosynthesis